MAKKQLLSNKGYSNKTGSSRHKADKRQTHKQTDIEACSAEDDILFLPRGTNGNSHKAQQLAKQLLKTY